MLKLILPILSFLFFIHIARKILSWHVNFQIAKKSGFPVYKSPVHTADIWWLASYPKLVPALRYFPSSLTRGWLPMSKVFHVWHAGYTPYKDLGTDNIILSSPNGNMLWTADPELINQISSQGARFVKPVELFGFFDIYGPNMQTAINDDWRFHRKMVAPAIGSHANTKMWEVSLFETKKFTDLLVRKSSIITLVEDCMSEITLHCVTQCFFDLELDFEHFEETSARRTQYGRTGFVEAIFTTIDKMGIIDIIPSNIRALFPLGTIREADRVYHDLYNHIEDLCEQALIKYKQHPSTINMTIMDTLISGTMPESAEKNGKVMSKEALIGNVFFFLLSGHGTSGNTMAFLMLILAIRQDVQKKMQDHLDTQLGGRHAESWTVTEDFAQLYRGYTGAVLKESMRLYNVVEFIPRRCSADTIVAALSGERFTVPKDTMCLLNYTAAFRHPDIWPASSESKDAEGCYHPTLDFNPARWESYGDEIKNPSDVGLRTYFPFGLGGRACLGKSLGSIMTVGILASVFKYYSLELVVPPNIQAEATKKSASDDWIQKRTHEHALKMLMDEVDCNLNIEMRKEFPIRFVPRTQF